MTIQNASIYGESNEATKWTFREGGFQLKLITLYVPEGDLAELDKLVQRKLYPHRAEAIRFAIRDLVREEAS